VCALTVARDARRRPRPDKVAWAVAFAVFAAAAGAEVVGSLWGWSAGLARFYYLTGATLVVGYLALGELYLLAPKRIGRVAPGATLLVTALAAAVVFGAPVDGARLEEEGWDALERGPGLVALTASINALGTLVLVGGALWSAWRFRRRGGQRHRMIGCVLIAVGTLVVAAGGTLTRLGRDEYFYVAMAAGVAVIYAGYLETRRPDPAGRPAVGAGMASAAPAPSGGGRAALVPLAAARDGRRVAEGRAGGDPAIAYIEERLLPLEDAALAAACREWSVERRVVERPEREEARRAWALRLRLSPTGQAAFDAHGLPARLQVSELYHEVLAPGVEEWRGERAGG
jgi:hypothetical protein